MAKSLGCAILVLSLRKVKFGATLRITDGQIKKKSFWYLTFYFLRTLVTLKHPELTLVEFYNFLFYVIIGTLEWQALHNSQIYFEMNILNNESAQNNGHMDDPLQSILGQER